MRGRLAREMREDRSPEYIDDDSDGRLRRCGSMGTTRALNGEEEAGVRVTQSSMLRGRVGLLWAVRGLLWAVRGLVRWGDRGLGCLFDRGLSCGLGPELVCLLARLELRRLVGTSPSELSTTYSDSARSGLELWSEESVLALLGLGGDRMGEVAVAAKVRNGLDEEPEARVTVVNKEDLVRVRGVGMSSGS